MTRFRDADVIIDVENGLPYFSPLWRRRPSLCLVHHVHTDQWHLTASPVRWLSACQAVERRVMPAIYRNRIFVAVSNSTAENLIAIGVPKDHIRVIESGVDIPLVPAAEQSKTTLRFPQSPVVRHKRVDLLLDSWAIASQEIPGAGLIIAGDGPEIGEPARESGDHPSSGNRRMCFRRNEATPASRGRHCEHGVPRRMGTVDHGLPAAGTPALAVDAPGIRDTVIDDVTGVLVRQFRGRVGVRLAIAWIRFSADGERRERLGGARRRAEQFGWDQTIDRWQSVLEAGHHD